MAKCITCGKELENIPTKRPKQFCNSTCRSNYWHREKRKSKKEAAETKKEDTENMPEGLNWKEKLEWKRNHKK